MDSWQATQSWLIFLGGASALGLYYLTQNKSAQPSATAARRQSVQQQQQQQQEQRPKTKRRADNERNSDESRAVEATAAKPAAVNETTKKRKAPNKPQAQVQPEPATVINVQEEDNDTVDLSTRQFAEQLAKVRNGTNLSAPKSKEQRQKTVKLTGANGSASLSDVDDGVSPAMNAGDVSDMLEPTSPGPSTLRLTAPAKAQKEKAARQPKGEVVESKKARQNRLKKEQQRLQREGEEAARKVLEEKQRRAAREARGEPAKNGIAVSQPPTSNAWTASKSAQPATEDTASANNGTPLLDTFDAESSASSNGAEPSTAATSTTGTETAHPEHDGHSEEEQMAMAMKQSEDESGWTTVAVPKKQQKKKPASDGETNGVSTPVEPMPTPKPKAVAPASKPVLNGKPKGFQALRDEYEQRTDVDPNDASNWDA